MIGFWPYVNGSPRQAKDGPRGIRLSGQGKAAFAITLPKAGPFFLLFSCLRLLLLLLQPFGRGRPRSQSESLIGIIIKTRSLPWTARPLDEACSSSRSSSSCESHRSFVIGSDSRSTRASGSDLKVSLRLEIDGPVSPVGICGNEAEIL